MINIIYPPYTPPNIVSSDASYVSTDKKNETVPWAAYQSFYVSFSNNLAKETCLPLEAWRIFLVLNDNKREDALQ